MVGRGEDGREGEGTERKWNERRDQEKRYAPIGNLIPSHHTAYINYSEKQASHVSYEVGSP